MSEQRAIGMATLQELLASRSRIIGGSVRARDPLGRNGKLFSQAGSEVIKIVGDNESEEMDNGTSE